MAEFSGFTPREAPGLPDDPNENLTITNTITSGFFVGDGSGLTGVSVSGISTTGTSTFNNVVITGITTFNNIIANNITTTNNITTNNIVVTGISTVGLGTTSSPANSQLSFELTSDTNLRIKVRGSDGVIRTADITLS